MCVLLDLLLALAQDTKVDQAHIERQAAKIQALTAKLSEAEAKVQQMEKERALTPAVSPPPDNANSNANSDEVATLRQQLQVATTRSETLEAQVQDLSTQLTQYVNADSAQRRTRRTRR